jgi:hypothetical protein
VDVLRNADPGWRRRAVFATAGLAVIGLVGSAALAAGFGKAVLAAVFGGGGSLASDGLVRPLVHASLALTGVAIGAVALAFEKKTAGTMVVVGVVAADLLTAGSAALPMAPALAFPTPPPLAEELQRHLGDGRFVRDHDPESLQLPLPENRAWAPAAWWYGMVDGAQGANWSLPMVYHSDAEVLAGRRMGVLAKLVWTRDWEHRLRLFRLAGVDLVMTPERPEIVGLGKVEAFPTAAPGLGYTLLRVQPPVPKAWWVPDADVASTSEKALESLLRDDFDPSRAAVREQSAVVTADQPAGSGILRPSTELVTATIAAATDGVVVTTTPWHPDLIFEVDGRMVRAERLNYAFAGVPVTAGRHDVRLLFAPRAVGWGATLSLMASLVWIGIVVVRWFRRRSTSRG